MPVNSESFCCFKPERPRRSTRDEAVTRATKTRSTRLIFERRTYPKNVLIVQARSAEAQKERNRPERKEEPVLPHDPPAMESMSRTQQKSRPRSALDHSVEERLDLSIVIPIYNEASSLEALHARLSVTLQEIGKSYEVIYVDDGSRDGSTQLLRQLYGSDEAVRVIRFNRNYGQHAAVLAGFERARGETIVTLDGDLQNPPEEIPKLLERVYEGHEVVGGWRKSRCDSVFRRAVSFVINRMISRIVGVPMRDYGCMLRAYRRSVVEQLVRCEGSSSFIPALATSLAGSAVELPVSHEPRPAGHSKYGLLRLLRLNFDLLTGFSLLPIQILSLSGIAISFLGLAFALFLGVRRLFVGPEMGGVFTLFAILFFFIGLQILALGLIGEYVGRIYQVVRGTPRYVISELLE